jgi:hypothetical protein
MELAKSTVQETKMVAERKTQKVPGSEVGHEIPGSHGDEATDCLSHSADRNFDGIRFGYHGGSQMAYGYPILDTTTQSAQRPSPDPIGGGASRTATKENFETDKGYERSSSTAPADQTSHEAPSRDEEPIMFGPGVRRESSKEVVPAAHRRSTSTVAKRYFIRGQIFRLACDTQIQ